MVSQITAHTTPIHTIRISPDNSTIATAAIGDRFINVLSLSKGRLARLGSLTCGHDVRSFTLQAESLLAITVIGTLEVFHEYNINFEPGKKAGLTKPPTTEIQLTTPHASNIEIQDVIARGKETLICWVEGAKTGFEVINIHDKLGKVEMTVQTRKEQGPQQVTNSQSGNLLIAVFNTLRRFKSRSIDGRRARKTPRKRYRGGSRPLLRRPTLATPPFLRPTSYHRRTTCRHNRQCLIPLHSPQPSPKFIGRKAFTNMLPTTP